MTKETLEYWIKIANKVILSGCDKEEYECGKELLAFAQDRLKGNVIDVSWSIVDVIARAKERGIKLSKIQAIDILDNIKRKHDAGIGINWEVIDAFIDLR